MKEIRSFIIDSIEKEIRIEKNNMTKNKRALQNPIPVSFEVGTISAEHGEENVSVKAESVDKASEKLLKYVNKKGYAPDNYYVFAYLQNGKKIEIPKKYWGYILKEKK